MTASVSSFLAVLTGVQHCSKCCEGDKCNNYLLEGKSASGALNLLASAALLTVMAVVAMVM